METGTTYMEPNIDPDIHENLSPNSSLKPKIVVIMGATGSGKSKLAIDLASHFPIEIINADSMQVYQGLDVLTNKVGVHERKGVSHHLLGTINPDTEFTAKDFREHAIPLINEIWSRNCLPVIVGGTNYYIQALVSPYLLNDLADDLEENRSLEAPGDNRKQDSDLEAMSATCHYTHSRLTNLDPVAANRIHPNDHRKIRQYLTLYERWGVLPSKLFLGNTMQNWGRVDNLRYNCCFICVDASLQALDQYVNQRVDYMVEAGLVEEVCEIYKSDSDYTRGLRQAIGVREFENFLGYQNSECQKSSQCPKMHKDNLCEFINSSGDPSKFMLKEAIDKVKLNTRRLVRRQKRRLNQLQVLFGWKIHYLDVTSCISCTLDESWAVNVVEPSVKIIGSFLENSVSSDDAGQSCEGTTDLPHRDLWTRYVCQACGNKELRGAHEWAQHRQGKGHRKRVSRLRMSLDLPKR
ncbi:tRNA dimethylallyltransferase 2 [Dorcoceras hygrometricum]|uniref:tRNA dimethylallyltransferase 2 n=1 Tax=Dorcoceras hygrometricum TaxID=472368 RepID=A0A2Z7BYS5_9LAMI|nr:tRNA dimethylallyltransferase 2 [Dorcoceras hygrometricum]